MNRIYLIVVAEKFSDSHPTSYTALRGFSGEVLYYGKAADALAMATALRNEAAPFKEAGCIVPEYLPMDLERVEMNLPILFDEIAQPA